MPSKTDYQVKVGVVVGELFPNLSEEAKVALVWVIVDVLQSLDAMATADDDR